ncbi:hypothetical protein HH310_21240 [Actinoplanes sp. TBRC 11911]|uniref:hypothetical protein n=1 Tax=Actinoplanes sp. TBRC 11911 TaxID=2729386 RepID=UPI00145CFE80|nr:hypothetical protein [Actinoplanes sp. TBRC 11911]NMO53698.1 hypothetical protein [Actinoplanes sp. TBRC 11911]
MVIGSDRWGNWSSLGGVTHSSPHIAVNADNTLALTHRADDGRMWNQLMFQYWGTYEGSGWTPESTGQATPVAPSLVTLDNRVYLLIVLYGWYVQYKRLQ